MADVNQVRAALETAGSLGGVLDAGWEAFDLLVTKCQQVRPSAPGALAPCAFAAATAAEARTILSVAPGLPASRPLPEPSGHAGLPSDRNEADGELRGLAELLHARLAEALDLPGEPRDVAACAHAAIQAALVHKLLAGGR